MILLYVIRFSNFNIIFCFLKTSISIETKFTFSNTLVLDMGAANNIGLNSFELIM